MNDPCVFLWNVKEKDYLGSRGRRGIQRVVQETCLLYEEGSRMRGVVAGQGSRGEILGRGRGIISSLLCSDRTSATSNRAQSGYFGIRLRDPWIQANHNSKFDYADD